MAFRCSLSLRSLNRCLLHYRPANYAKSKSGIVPKNVEPELIGPIVNGPSGGSNISAGPMDLITHLLP